MSRSFQVTIDLPIIVSVEAEDEDAAEELGDERFRVAYDLVAEAVRGWRAAGVWPEGTYLGARYDDTDVEEEEVAAASSRPGAHV